MTSVTNSLYVDKLVAVGFSKYEALAYLALLEKNNTTALDIVDRSGIPKQRIYDVLDNLQTKGLCAVRKGRPRCFIAYPPHQALTAVLNYRKRQQALENERQARLIKEMVRTLSKSAFNGKGSEPAPSSQSDSDVDAYRDIGGL